MLVVQIRARLDELSHLVERLAMSRQPERDMLRDLNAQLHTPKSRREDVRP